MPRVFISHSSLDRGFVETTIVQPLKSHGISAWYSQQDIRSGAEWERSIRNGLESCDWFLVVLSPRSVNSVWVTDEVHWAMDERANRIIPVLMEECDWKNIHLRMRRIQLIDFRHARREAQRRLLQTWGVELRETRQVVIDSSKPLQQATEPQREEKIDSIRRRGSRVGRNDPCPCGSGKKYKQCCQKKL